MITQKILLLLLSATTLFACSEQENPAERTSTLKLGYAVQQVAQKTAQGSDTTAPQSIPKQMVITIHDEHGNPVLNGERFDLIKIGEEYYSKSILLPTGHYTLEEFMVIDSADQAIYIAPKSGSEMADFVEHPLPRSFQVEEGIETKLHVQVMPAYLGSGSEFGYVSFPFEVVNPSAVTDITRWKWELQSVTSGNKTLSPQKSDNTDYLQDNAYLLEFESDSTFWLPTSINVAGGYYTIIKNGVISISNYHEFTEVATTEKHERELNDSLVSVFNKVTNYEAIRDTLHFQGKDREVTFNKK